MQEFLQNSLRKGPAACIGCRARLLFQGFAVIEYRDAVEEQNILCAKRQPASKPLRLYIADIDQRDFCVGAGQKRREAAGKRIAEDHKLAVCFCVRICDRKQGLGAGEKNGMFSTRITKDGAVLARVDPTDFTKAYTETAIAVETSADSVTYRIPRVLLPDGSLWWKAADSRETIRCGADFYDKGDTIPAGRLWFAER